MYIIDFFGKGCFLEEETENMKRNDRGILASAFSLKLEISLTFTILSFYTIRLGLLEANIDTFFPILTKFARMEEAILLKNDIN